MESQLLPDRKFFPAPPQGSADDEAKSDQSRLQGVLYCTPLYSTVLYCSVLYSTVLYCTLLYCTVL